METNIDPTPVDPERGLEVAIQTTTGTITGYLAEVQVDQLETALTECSFLRITEARIDSHQAHKTSSERWIWISTRHIISLTVRDER